MSDKRPNILIILADDLGYSDIGCYGSEIHTPNLDALAGEGVRLTNYHTAAACSPTRSMIMSGTDNHLTGVGAMIEYKQQAKGAEKYGGRAGYDGYMNKDVACIAEILGDNGYYTAHGGKWHLGLRPSHGPHARGFKNTFAVLPGCCNHFGWEPVLETGYAGMPMGGRPLHAENGKRHVVAPNKTEDPNGFYSSDHYTDKLIGYLQDRPEEDKDKPFFGYLAFSAPHWPLQSRKESREKYWNTYNDGPAELRKRRLAKLVELGLVPASVLPHEVVAPEVAEWDSFSPAEKLASSRAMAAYAGMVDEIDHNVGKIVQYLKDAGQYDNTMIMFMSDNGAEGAALEAIPVMSTKLIAAIHEFYDNSPDNIGAWNSYTWLGPLWAQASTAPSRLYKMYPSEGGILVPCIVKAPKGSWQDKWQNGAICKTFTTCMDLAATFCDLNGISLPPAPTQGKVVFRGREVYAMRGKSWKPFFIDGNPADASGEEEFGVYPEDEPIGWELHSRAALRKGRWKITHLPESHGGKGRNNDNPDGWELFDVVADPGETEDLGDKHPDKLKELLRHWQEYVKMYGVVWGENRAKVEKTKEEEPMLWDSQFEIQRTWMQTPAGSAPVIA